MAARGRVQREGEVIHLVAELAPPSPEIPAPDPQRPGRTPGIGTAAPRLVPPATLILQAGLMAARGRVQREGEVIHLVAEHLIDRSDPPA
jgi:hypothetical protein